MTKVYLGNFESGVNHLIIPSEVLRSAESELARPPPSAPP